MILTGFAEPEDECCAMESGPVAGGEPQSIGSGQLPGSEHRLQRIDHAGARLVEPAVVQGEGGAVATSNPDWAQKLRLRRNVGIDVPQMRFLDTFLLYCLTADSPADSEQESRMMGDNQLKVVEHGRRPDLMLVVDASVVVAALVDDIGDPELLDGALRGLVSGLDPYSSYLDADEYADLRVSTMESFAAKWLAPRLHRFHRIRPDLRVRIETGNAHADFVRDGVDVAIRYGAGGYAGVDAERFLEAAVFPVCAPAVLGDAARPLATAHDLQRHTLLQDESAHGRPGVPGWSDWLDAAGATRVSADEGPVFASIYLAQEAAIAGHGVALGVAPLVAEDLRSGRLARPFELALDNAYAFWIVRRRGAAANPAVDAFCEWLRGEAVGETQPSQ